MERGGEFAELFSFAFSQSRNAMVLLDSHRLHVDVNGAYLRLSGYRRDELIGRPIFEHVLGGPKLSPAEWEAALASQRTTGEGELICADGSIVAVQWAADTEVVTGRRLVLLVALSTSRWGRRFRRTMTPERELEPLSAREREIVRLVALGNTGPEKPPSSASPTTPSALTRATRWRRWARARAPTWSRKRSPKASR